MINEEKSITLAEVKVLLDKIDTDKAKAVVNFIKKFIKLKASDALKLKKAIADSGIVKLKEKDIVKIIDFMPQDAGDVRKIFTGADISLDQDEITKILEILKQKK